MYGGAFKSCMFGKLLIIISMPASVTLVMRMFKYVNGDLMLWLLMAKALSPIVGGSFNLCNLVAAVKIFFTDSSSS